MTIDVQVVNNIKHKLNEQSGLALALDGQFDEPTVAALQQYQTTHDLAVTGFPDQTTLRRLFYRESVQ